ncbi:MAG: DUF58 domain-containing protein [Lentisphaeria bacterium]|nr:DUF58 domain-containing protein [Lentisphaeria bacterium]
MSGPSDRVFDPEIIEELGRIDWIADAIVDGFKQGLHRSTTRGFSTEFSEFKPYTKGDDPRFLDWRLFARTRRLFVRRFEAETNMTCSLLLDCTRSMAWQWESTVPKLRYGANLAAALARLFLHQQDCVALYAAAGRGEPAVLPPSSRRDQLDHIYAVLAAQNPNSAPCLDALFTACLGQSGARGQLILFSDLEEGGEEGLSRLPELLSMGHEAMVVHILDRAEVELPFSDGITHLVDSESGARHSVDMPELRRRHDGEVAAFRARWRRLCAKHGAAYVPLDTGVDYVTALRHIVAGRRHFIEMETDAAR